MPSPPDCWPVGHKAGLGCRLPQEKQRRSSWGSSYCDLGRLCPLSGGGTGPSPLLAFPGDGASETARLGGCAQGQPRAGRSLPAGHQRLWGFGQRSLVMFLAPDWTEGGCGGADRSGHSPGAAVFCSGLSGGLRRDTWHARQAEASTRGDRVGDIRVRGPGSLGPVGFGLIPAHGEKTWVSRETTSSVYIEPFRNRE